MVAHTGWLTPIEVQFRDAQWYRTSRTVMQRCTCHYCIMVYSMVLHREALHYAATWCTNVLHIER